MARVSGKNDPDKTLMRLGAAIRRARIERKISQEALADSADIDRSHLGRIERGERNVSILNIARIAKELQLSISELLAAADL